MKANGWWNEPDISVEVEHAQMWYAKTLKWREYESGLPKRLGIKDIKELYSVYDSALDIEYLADLVNAIDLEYIKQLSKQRG